MFKKKKFIKKVAAISMALICATIPNAMVFAEELKPDVSVTGGMVPFNVAITTCDYTILQQSPGKMTCFGSTLVKVGYTAKVLVDLQQDGQAWRTIGSWSDKGGRIATVEEVQAVEKGHSYRVRTTHQAYDSNGKLVETIIKYTSIISYK